MMNIVESESKTSVDKRNSHDPRSEEYLKEAFKFPIEDYAFPIALKGFGLTVSNLDGSTIERFKSIIAEVNKIGRYLGIQKNALIMAYPKDGYIGWHHNGNAPGYNILFSYSLDGEGTFSYWDYETKSINEIRDEPGWNVKVGYYPNQRKESNRVYWHEAHTKNQRVTIAYVIDHKEMWSNMIEDITMGNFDRSVLDQ